ncbi:MAG: cupin domain-containing protein [Alphaproteobacteria bacterium]|nr:cupin domain-containing protein [Alphaproteobacteria bacterium]
MEGEALERLAGAPAETPPPIDAKLALDAHAVEIRAQRSNYPEPFYSRMAGRAKRVLGDRFGLKNFGVNLTTLAPGGESSVLHRHTRQDEFVFVVSGEPTLVTDEGETTLRPGACAGFAAGGRAHQLVNRTPHDVVYLEIGDRTPDDSADYPADDLALKRGDDGKLRFTRKDGSAY